MTVYENYNAIALKSCIQKFTVNAVYIPNTVNTTYPLILAIREAKNGLVTDRLKNRLFRFPK